MDVSYPVPTTARAENTNPPPLSSVRPPLDYEGGKNKIVGIFVVSPSIGPLQAVFWKRPGKRGELGGLCAQLQKKIIICTPQRMTNKGS